MLHLEKRCILHILTYMHTVRTDPDLLVTHPLATQQHDGPVFVETKPKSNWFKRSFLYQGIARWYILDSSPTKLMPPPPPGHNLTKTPHCIALLKLHI